MKKIYFYYLNFSSFIFFASTRIERRLHDVAGEFETRSVC